MIELSDSQVNGLELASRILDQGPDKLDSDERLMASQILASVADSLPKGHPLRGQLAQESLGFLSPKSSETPSGTTSEIG